MIEIVSPIPLPAPDGRPAIARPTHRDVRGRVVAVVNNDWGSMDALAPLIEEELRRHYGVRDVVHVRNPNKMVSTAPEFFNEIAAVAAGAITGLGN